MPVDIAGTKDRISLQVVGRSSHISSKNESEVQVGKEERNRKIKRERKAHFPKRRIRQERFQKVIKKVIEHLKLRLIQLQKVKTLLMKEKTCIQEPEE